MTEVLRKIVQEARPLRKRAGDTAAANYFLKGLFDLISPRSKIRDTASKYGPAALEGLVTFKATKDLTDKLGKLPVYLRPKLKKNPDRPKIWMNLSSDQRQQAYNAVNGLSKAVDAINGASFLKQPIVAAQNKDSIDANKKTLTTLGLL